MIDSIEDFAVYAVIDDYLANLTAEVCPVIVSGCITASKDKQEKAELKHMFDEYMDRVLMECAVENLARLYEGEEEQIHL